MQRQEEKANMREHLLQGWLDHKKAWTKPDNQNTSSSSGSLYHTSCDAEYGPVMTKRPFAEVNSLLSSVPPSSETTIPLNQRTTTHKPGKAEWYSNSSAGNQNPDEQSFRMMSVSHHSGHASFFILMSFGQISSGLVLHLEDVWTNQFRPRSSS
ncbi:hypothetical protein Tco_0386959 [Tanacetum coccineum]